MRRIGRPRWLSLLGASPVAISLGLSLFLLSPSVSAQTAEELEKQYGREAMQKALETKHNYDLYGIHFDVDKATIRPETQPLFDDIAQVLKNVPMWRLSIVGHTDATGDAAYNQRLSLERANAVKSALVDRGIQASRLETEGVGQNQPVASNDTPEGRALNRRVALVRLDAKPNIVMLMTDDTGWNDFGYMPGGGKALGHPTPNINRIAREGAVFTNWYGQASCTAGRASFMTGRIPIRTALSIVVAPGDPNALKKDTPTIAEFFQKNGYTTYFSGKWHLGDKPDAYPIEHGFDEMKHFGAYYPGVYTYNDTSPQFHPWFPSYNAEFNKMYNEVVNLGEWEGEAGKPARRTGTINWDYLATFDIRQADSAIGYIQSHAKSDKPFFMSVNFMKMHNPNNPAPPFRGRTKLGNYSDSMLELDSNIGRIMEAIRAEAPDTIVIVTADNGAWQDAYPDAGTVPFRGMKGTGFEGGFRVPGLMWWPGKIPAGAMYDEMMSHIDCWATLATMVGLKAPPTGEMMDNNGKPIYFDSVDNSAYILGKAEHSARDSWVYIDGETFLGVRSDIGGDPKEPWLKIAWKYLYTAKDSWLGATADLGAIGAIYNLTMDPFEKYDMTFNGAASTRVLSSSPGKYAGSDNAWSLAMFYQTLVEFDKSIVKYPSIERAPGGASNDLVPNLKDPKNPVPYADPHKHPQVGGGGG